MEEISLNDYLKSELIEARNDFKDRCEAHDRIKKRHYELSTSTTKAQSRKELVEIITIVDSWLRIFDQLECDENNYMGDVPDSYLSQPWSSFVKEWRPKFLTIRDGAVFKVNEKIEHQQVADKMDYNRLRKELVQYLDISEETLRNLVEHGKIEPGASATWKGSRADAYRFAHWLSPGNKRFKNIFNNAVKMEKRPLQTSDGDETKDFVLELSDSISDVLKRYQK